MGMGIMQIPLFKKLPFEKVCHIPARAPNPGLMELPAYGMGPGASTALLPSRFCGETEPQIRPDPCRDPGLGVGTPPGSPGPPSVPVHNWGPAGPGRGQPGFLLNQTANGVIG